MLGWLDHRTGLKKLIALMLLEDVPGGARWRYVWGSCLVFVFSVQLITGLMLMTAYSPSSSQAWASVHFIQYKMDFGWLIRGLHHFGSQTMMILIALHMLQVVIAGAHLPPREVNWWLGIGLLSITIGLSLTGYLLPWDQKGFWATDVATNIAGSLPEIGAAVKIQAIGGPDSGNHTLTRFYALHAGILPVALIVLLVAHIVIFRRHGVTSKANQEGLVTKPENEHAPGTEAFWPRQAFYDMFACMVIFGLMLSAVLYGFAHPVTPPAQEDGPEPGLYEKIARWGVEGKGAELDAAADRETAGYPARPEWYFLFLFQLLKYFPGDYAIYGTVIIPNGAMLLLFLLPLFGIGSFRKFGYVAGLVVMLTLLAGVGFLTLKALDDDKPEGILEGILKGIDAPIREKDSLKKEIEQAKSFKHKVEDAEILAKRACQLAMDGVPVEGGHFLIRNDPFITGSKLFEHRCGSCHAFTARDTDSFTRTLLKIEYEQDLTDKRLAEIRGELKKKNIAFSAKITVKTLEEGKRWRLDDPESNWIYFVDRRGTELDISTRSMTDGKTASDLGDFASKDWIRGLLKDPMDNKHFGLVKKPDNKNEPGLTGMRGWRRGIDSMRVEKAWDKEKIAAQEGDFDAIAGWLADQSYRPETRDPFKLEAYKKGQDAFFTKQNQCAKCHTVEKGTKDEKTGKTVFLPDGGDSGPELTRYGSDDWIRAMIMRPGHKSRYDEKNLMPAFRNLDGPRSKLAMQEFRETNPTTKDSGIVHMSDIERELIIRWIQRDYRPIYGGTPIR